jgi:hypothetical protein
MKRDQEYREIFRVVSIVYVQVKVGKWRKWKGSLSIAGTLLLQI